MDRLKRVRRPLRGQLTRTINECTTILGSDNPDKAVLRAKLQSMQTLMESIEEQDAKIKDQMVDDDVDEEEEDHELSEMTRYKESFLTIKNKIEDLIVGPPTPTASEYDSTSQASGGGGKTGGYILPKIELKTFNGDLKQWLGWWSQFEKIHDNGNLHATDKFQYLANSMVPGSEAAELVDTYLQTAENYPKVIEAMKERFGRHDLLLQVYLRELLTLVISNVTSKDKIPLPSLYLKLESHLRALSTLNLANAGPATWLFPLVESSLSEDTLRAWQRSPLSKEDGSQSQPPKTKLDFLMEFIKTEVRSEQQITLAQSGFQSNTNVKKAKSNGSKASKVKNEDIATAAGLTTGQAVNKCGFCGKGHDTDRCVTALSQTLEDRKKIVREKKLCYICLRPNHSAQKCRAVVKCAACNGKHYPIMCNKLGTDKGTGNENKQKTQSDSSDVPVSEMKSLSLESQLPSASNSNSCSGDVLLQTIKVKLLGGDKPLTVRLVGDNGSQRSYIRRSTLDKIKRNKVGQEWLQNVVFGGSVTRPELVGRYQLSLCRLGGGAITTLELLEKDQLCGALPRTPYGPWLNELKSKGVILTDIGNGCADVDILIGNDLWGTLLTNTPIVKLECGLYAQETILGWTLGGRIPRSGANLATVVTSMIATNPNMTDMWTLEVLGIRDPIEVKSNNDLENEAKAYFTQTVERDQDGRYVVALPWKSEPVDLPTNFSVALQRLKNATSKLNRDGKWELYNKVFQSWEQEGIIHEVEANPQIGHYLPHRPVFKDSVTTPVRPVFDASCRWGQNGSLNDFLHKGPNLLEIIPALILRFRENKIGVTSDIRKAFQMLRVKEDDKKYQKFLWWADSSCEVIKAYQHDRVVFGMNCSPYLLGASINHHLDNSKGSLKKVSEKLRESFYVDNCVTSVPTMEAFYDFKEKATGIMKEAKMDLRQWAHTIQTKTPREMDNLYAEDLTIEVKPSVTVLGIIWDRQTDTLSCDIEEIETTEKVTKRQILSAVSKIFDPMGFLCPATLIPKLILQELWSRKIGWDETLPEEIIKKFHKWIQEVPLLRNVKIRRHMQLEMATEREVHVFNDACMYGYGSIIFLRTEYMGMVEVEMLMAKSRLAPLKKNTIPRLELTACLVGARLAKVVRAALKFEEMKFVYWTDSTTSLAWIKRQLDVGVYVSNRRKEILATTEPGDWNFIPGEDNPADLISRGCSPRQLLESKFWNGPSWLRHPKSEWPTSEIQTDEIEVMAELKKTSSCFSSILERQRLFSSYHKNAAVYAYIQRFINASRKMETNRGQRLSIKEIRKGETLMLKELQKLCFTKEDDYGGLSVRKHEDGLLRITTRLSNRKDSAGFLYPILLPKNHPLVDILVMDFHKSFCHAGVQFVMTKLREKYWILQSRRTIRRVLRQCVVCQQFKVKALTVDPVSLPEERVKDAEPFETTGVDLAGPLFLRDGAKAWIVLYTCAVYRCVHLDLVTSLSTEAFLGSLERFISQYGRPNTIFSDNGTNFVGTRNLMKTLDWEDIEKTSGVKQIRWRLNPPTAAWWGGWWEKLVHIMKELLKRMLGRARLDYDKLRTCLASVCATMNERPLTIVTEDTDDLHPLTPAMFMRGKCVGFLPETENVETLSGAYRKLKNIQKQLQDRFRKEYLSMLVQKKNDNPKYRIQVGDVVLVGADNKKRFEWPLGRVEKLFPGKDGKIRVAEVRVKAGILTRPLQRLYPLEVTDGQQLSEKAEVKTKEKVASKDQHRKHRTKPMEHETIFTKSGRKVKSPARYGQCAAFII